VAINHILICSKSDTDWL